ncbi:hypothetical protein IW143_004819, partial [Coemansia sp. RSA 520]
MRTRAYVRSGHWRTACSNDARSGVATPLICVIQYDAISSYWSAGDPDATSVQYTPDGAFDDCCRSAIYGAWKIAPLQNTS